MKLYTLINSIPSQQFKLNVLSVNKNQKLYKKASKIYKSIQKISKKYNLENRFFDI